MLGRSLRPVRSRGQHGGNPAKREVQRLQRAAPTGGCGAVTPGGPDAPSPAAPRTGAAAQECTGAVRVSRRAAGGGLALLAASGSSALARAQAAAAPPPLPDCAGVVDGQLAAALTRAVYSSVVQLQVMDEADFQRESFKLREREYRYYADATPQLPRIPDLADQSGGLANSAYLNFLLYCLWKVVFRHMMAPADREAFSRAVATNFLAQVWPAGLAAATAPAATTSGDGGAAAPAQPRSCAATSAAVVRVVVPFLELLRAGGYVCAYQLVLNDHPGSWPQDWMLSQPTLLDAGDDAAPGDASGPGSGSSAAASSSPPADSAAGAGTPCGEFLFQVKLHRPADILGSVALRSEEGGAWPHTVSSCIELLLEPLGFSSAPDPPAPTAQQQAQQAQQAQAGSLLEVSEYFYQDAWSGPTGWAERLLLFLGDPLEQVGVDFVPTSLVQNWRLRPEPL